MAVTPPETARLRFRAFTAEDLPLLTALNGDALVRKHLYGTPAAAETEQELESYRALYREKGFGMWAAFDKATAAFLGRAGLKYLDAAQQELAFGVVFMPQYWRGGYAPEAAQAVVEWAFRHVTGLETLYVSVQAQRRSACRALERAGFAPHREVINKAGESWAVYCIGRKNEDAPDIRSAWRKASALHSS